MMKINWDLMIKRDDLWVQVVRTKYGCGDGILPNIRSSKTGSNLWRGICNAYDDFQKGLICKIGNGRSINIWNDYWIPNIGGLGLFQFRGG